MTNQCRRVRVRVSPTLVSVAPIAPPGLPERGGLTPPCRFVYIAFSRLLSFLGSEDCRSTLLPDGTRVLADGRRVLADGTVLDADGNIIGFMGADGKFTSGVKGADGSFTLNDGTRVLADGTRILADGTRILADGTRVLADGTRVLADGTRILADGTRILADGTVVDADGNVIGFMGADGNVVSGNRFPNGYIPRGFPARICYHSTWPNAGLFRCPLVCRRIPRLLHINLL